jgi:AcrR family transcriptional regulator
MELLVEKRYEAITVRDILHRAGIGSSTFYAHYFDKADVQTSVIAQIIEQMATPLSGNMPRSDVIPSLELFRHIQEHFPQIQALARGHALEQMWEMAQTTISRTIEQSLGQAYAGKRPSAIPLAVVAQYLAGAYMNLLKWWIEAEMPYSAERIDEIFRQLAWNGLQTAIEGEN